jgi:tetratricopeptide (TPR) repeat protein
MIPKSSWRWSYFLGGVGTSLILLILLYQLPPIQNRLAWRVDILMTRIRTLIQPVGQMPTPEIPSDGRVVKQPANPFPTFTQLSKSTQTPVHLNETSQPHNPPTPTAEATPTLAPLPGQVNLTSPKYERQDWNNCGPASLALYLRFFGWDGNQFSISDVVKPLRPDRNVNIDELVHYVREHVGWLNAEFRVGGNQEILRQFLANGIPVMVEETFYLEDNFWVNDDRWAGHYLLLTGYDDVSQAFTVQDSFVGPDRKVSYADLDKNWQAFNRAYLMVYRPEQAATVQSILGSDWDVNANRQHALDTALSETQKDPQNGFAWFNLGSNQVYFDRYLEAARAYDKARQIGFPQRMLRYQFGPFLAYFNSGRNEDLLSITDYALKVTPNSEEALVWRGWALYRNGQRQQALEQFKLALENHPDYQDALYGLDFVQSN